MFLRSLIVIGSLMGLAYFVAYPIGKVVDSEIGTFIGIDRHVKRLPYNAEAVRFKTHDNLTLAGSYAPSRNGATILLVHGSEASRNQVETIAQLLIDHGYGVLSYDSRGNGESEGFPGYGDKEVLDVRAALDFLEQRSVDRQKIGAYGFSLGAFTLARAASHDERIKSFVLASVFTSALDLASDSDGGGVHGFLSAQIRMLVGEFFGQNTYGVGILDTIPFISPRPILFLGGEEDGTVPPKRVREVFAAAREPKSLVIFEGAGHGDYREKNKERFESVVLSHFQTTLLPSSARLQKN